MNYGIDGGWWATKLVGSEGSLTFPSLAGDIPATLGNASINLSKKVPEYVMRAPYQYIIGKAAQTQGVGSPDLREDWVLHEPYHALILTALASQIKSGTLKANIVLGLPVGYIGLAPKLAALASGVFDVKLDGQRQVKLDVRARVFPQGLGALACSFLDDEGNVVGGSIEEVLDADNAPIKAVIDVGAGTTCAVQMAGAETVANKSLSVKVGAWAIERIVRDEIAEAHGPSLVEGVSRHDMMGYIQQGQMTDFGRTISIEAIAREARNSVAQEILHALRAKWDNARNISDIIICGGGGQLLQAFFRAEYPQARMIPGIAPQLANATGYYRLSKLLDA